MMAHTQLRWREFRATWNEPTGSLLAAEISLMAAVVVCAAVLVAMMRLAGTYRPRWLLAELCASWSVVAAFGCWVAYVAVRTRWTVRMAARGVANWVVLSGLLVLIAWWVTQAA